LANLFKKPANLLRKKTFKNSQKAEYRFSATRDELPITKIVEKNLSRGEI